MFWKEFLHRYQTTMKKTELQSDFDAFRAKFRIDELGLCSLGQWTLSLRPYQATLASMVLSASNPCLTFGELSKNCDVNLQKGFAIAERLAFKGFGAIRLNILCLMLQDPHMHFHILPRYDKPISFKGLDWIDTAWPTPITKLAGHTDEETLLELRDHLRLHVARDSRTT
jgi:diadenosine tetraphosphate (Ap4A) HIT family hydrolase